jgi:uncharacterized protein (TIGR02118 family)
MFCVTVAYPRKDDGRFDFDYYTGKHIPMVMSRLGATGVRAEVRRGVGSPDGSAPSFVCTASVWITSVEGLNATLAQHGQEIMGDIPNYTNLQPIIQVDEVLG